ncbi:uncharacterized protein LOC119293641 [Triticum dicoccoides]|uniref:uncharacterized protein LOC119293641 n=1 Tax=Triticum dicoccoides TaxID=85692 RepID=UPI00188FF395|nr:uncharacterized protein LOC119293641 [Triticum dicoccoides]
MSGPVSASCGIRLAALHRPPSTESLCSSTGAAPSLCNSVAAPCAAQSRLPCSSVVFVSPFPSPTPIGGARSGGGGAFSWQGEVQAHGAPPAASAVHSMQDELGNARDAVQSLCPCSTASAISSHWSVDHGRAARKCSRCRSKLVPMQYGERHLFPLVGVPWPCSSEMLAMWFWTCVCAVGRAPSPSLPVWSVNYGCAARRHSSFDSGLMRVQSCEGHLFPCS